MEFIKIFLAHRLFHFFLSASRSSRHVIIVYIYVIIRCVVYVSYTYMYVYDIDIISKYLIEPIYLYTKRYTCISSYMYVRRFGYRYAISDKTSSRRVINKLAADPTIRHFAKCNIINLCDAIRRHIILREREREKMETELVRMSRLCR